MLGMITNSKKIGQLEGRFNVQFQTLFKKSFYKFTCPSDEILFKNTKVFWSSFSNNVLQEHIFYPNFCHRMFITLVSSDLWDHSFLQWQKAEDYIFTGHCLPSIYFCVFVTLMMLKSSFFIQHEAVYCPLLINFGSLVGSHMWHFFSFFLLLITGWR